jgi:hypothetical protein
MPIPLLKTNEPRIGIEVIMKKSTSLVQAVDNVSLMLAEMRADAEKADAGNKAANVRVRKAAQDIRNYLFAVRQLAMDKRD